MSGKQLDEKAIFKVACSIESTEARNDYLDQVCGDKPELIGRVATLLRMQREEPRFLEAPAVGIAPTIDLPASDERPGTCIGPYKLLEQIGSGGMGAVYLAEQKEPLCRKVALKVIKPGMDTHQVVARFEAERQALAMMNHPNIAKVLDAGATDAGRPYFVMELVKGTPITEFCDRQKLDTRERLQLFITVCQAVQHAHRKGLIHRDIKPSNVLVEVHDVTAVPKVIDFGVAKAIGQSLTEKTLHTGFGQMVGTPLYMSPEQAGQSSIDVDTRSDIYSLGVMLYEMLTGHTPFESETLRSVGFDEMRRMIREVDPPRPSARVSTLEAKALSTVSDCRKVEPHKLSQQLRGELDWIVMKALEKDRERRYESATSFAADIQRYLNDEPVQACLPTALYRFGKIARRNKAAIIMSTLVAAAILVGSAVASWQAVVATHAKKEALDSAKSAKTAKETAETREAETRAVLDFVENKVFAAARPKGRAGGMGYDVTLAAAVQGSLPFLDQSFTKQPLIEARLRMAIGNSFMYLGKPEVAEKQFLRSRELLVAHRGPGDPDMLGSMNNLANSYLALGRLADALKLHEQTLALRKATLGPDHADTINSMNNVAGSYLALGRYADALKLHEQTLALRKATLGPDHADTIVSMNNVAGSYTNNGRLADSLKLYEETLALRKATLGPDHPDTLTTMEDIAATYRDLGQGADALKLYEETLALRKATLGPDHPDTLFTMQGLASTYLELGQSADAVKLLDETLALQKAMLAPDHPETLHSIHLLAASYFALGRLADVLKLNEELLPLMKAKLGPDHPRTLLIMNNMAWLLATSPDAKLRDAARAVELATEAVARTATNSTFNSTLYGTLGTAYYRLGDWKAAITALNKSLELDPDNASHGFFLAMAHWQLGDKDQATKYYTQAIEWMDKNGPQDEELVRFRAEAEQLLGIEGETK